MRHPIEAGPLKRAFKPDLLPSKIQIRAPREKIISNRTYYKAASRVLTLKGGFYLEKVYSIKETIAIKDFFAYKSQL